MRLAALLLTVVIEVVTVLCLLSGLAVIRAVAPPANAGVAFFDVRAAPPAPPEPARARAERDAAPMPPHAAGAGRHAVARAVAAPVPRIALATPAAPAIAATGQADSVGAARDGTGAGTAGQGNGGGGGGFGGGIAVRAIKLSGDIDSARDYPAATRDLRLGDHVILALGIDPSGAVDDCRVLRASRDAAADAITCRLARERFRFRPARDATGHPVRSIFGWQQRWFRRGGG